MSEREISSTKTQPVNTETPRADRPRQRRSPTGRILYDASVIMFGAGVLLGSALKSCATTGESQYQYKPRTRESSDLTCIVQESQQQIQVTLADGTRAWIDKPNTTPERSKDCTGVLNENGQNESAPPASGVPRTTYDNFPR